MIVTEGMTVLEQFEEKKYLMSSRYGADIDGYEFYKFIFPNNERSGEMNTDFSKPNAIYLYKNDDETSERKMIRRIMLSDTWEDDYMNNVEMNEKALCSGLAYVGRANRIQNATKMNAMIFDIDGVDLSLLDVLTQRFTDKVQIRSIPYPTFTVLSGTGVHLYYVFDEPIPLYPNIKTQLKALKHDLTRRFWDYGGTSRIRNIQYQGISQNFRMVGSINDKYGNVVTAYRTGDKISLDELNKHTFYEENRVDLRYKFRPSKMTLEEAEKRYPDWFERVIIKGEKTKRKWSVSRDLYDWWKDKKISEATAGHRYYFMMCMAIYAVKCDIPKKELEEDLQEAFEYLKHIKHENELTEDDIRSALEMYDKTYYLYTLDDISKLSAIPIQRTKRNGRSQEQHMKVMNAIRDALYPNGEWRNKKGAPTKERLVKDYIADNPNKSVTEIARALNVSRPTVYKYRK